MSRKTYFIRRSCDDDYEADALDSLARTVYEDYEIIDTGVIDADGNPIMARRRFDPIGFVRFKAH